MTARATGRSMVDKPAFNMRDYVEKISGSSWRGHVVGTYSTDLTPEGYAVESDTEKGSVQIYPAKALRLATPANGEQVGQVRERLRQTMNQQKVSGDRNTYTDGFQQGLAHALDLIATLSTPTEDARERVKVLEEARRNLRLTQGCLECNADDERRWMETITWLESLA